MLVGQADCTTLSGSQTVACNESISIVGDVIVIASGMDQLTQVSIE